MGACVELNLGVVLVLVVGGFQVILLSMEVGAGNGGTTPPAVLDKGAEGVHNYQPHPGICSNGQRRYPHAEIELSRVGCAANALATVPVIAPATVPVSASATTVPVTALATVPVNTFATVPVSAPATVLVNAPAAFEVISSNGFGKNPIFSGM